MSMFHVKHIMNKIRQYKLSEILLFIFILIMPWQTRILFNSETSYTEWYFNYHQAIFLYLTDLVFLVIIGSLLVEHVKLRFKSIFVTIFITLCALGLFHVQRHDLGIYNLFKWTQIVSLIIIIPSILTTRPKLYIAVFVLFISGAMQALIAIIQFHVQHMVGLRFMGEYISSIGTAGLSTIDVANEKIIRAYGTMPHPNVLGGYLLTTLSSGLILVSRATKYKLYFFFGIILTLLGIFLSFSRSAWIAGLFILVSYETYLLFKKNYKLFFVSCATLIVSCATITILYQPYVVSRATNVSNSTAVTDRQLLNEKSLEIFYINPWQGTGVGNYVSQMQNTFHMEPWQYQPPHNIFLFILAELGILGFLSFVLMIAHIVGKSFNKTFLWWMCGTTIFAILLIGTLDHYFVTIQQGRLMLGLMLGLTLATKNIKNDSHETIH